MSFCSAPLEKGMNMDFRFFQKIKLFLSLFFFLGFLIFQTNNQITYALFMGNSETGVVTEELRLKIPMEFKKFWLDAEKNIWEPWLSKQEGYLGRQLFWDQKREEGLILVNWKNKQLWKEISIDEVNEVQKKFEENVKESLELDINPFELIYEGEIYKQA